MALSTRREQTLVETAETALSSSQGPADGAALPSGEKEEDTGSNPSREGEDDDGSEDDEATAGKRKNFRSADSSAKAVRR
jgi:hypothetical protein